ncbi:MAG: YCF48-related protein [Terracidiphilus sp.]
MMETLHRYPGAQPFRDDEFSRRTFFGRESASVALTDQILANRLIIVYAKSGLGKTSLLNAGVAPRLREAGSLPLFVRVNDIKSGPLLSVLEGVRAEAERQQVEYVPGDTSSLWSFFKTVEFWRNDLLLTPVLILDQFEELFTLQSQEAREGFLSELGYLLRGVAPPSQPKMESIVSEGPPSIRVVLSLREDFLGLLEEASDHIPEILDHRYRLAPLIYEMASKAITGPAAIESGDVATRAFRLEPQVVTSILDYLTKSTSAARGTAVRHVEPFHLQLICQRIERIAAAKQKASSGEIVVSFKDLGGDAALAETLESFYTDAIRSLPARYLRGAARVLCEQYLISPEGRRLSVEERELLRQLKLPRETLSQLVERRLLRTDRRSDSTYYELSHDALVQPVLASRRVQALVVSWAAVLAGSITCLAAGAFILLCVVTVFSGSVKSTSDYFFLPLFVVLSLFLGAGGLAWFRSGQQRLRRYRRHTPSEFTELLPTLLPLKVRMLGWVLLGTGSTVITVWGLVGLFGLVKYGIPILTHGIVPHWLNWMAEDMQSAWPLVHDHPFLEMLWWVVEHTVIVLFGYLLLRQGTRALWPHRFTGQRKAAPALGVNQASAFVLASVKGISGCIALVVAALGLFSLRSCATAWHGNVPPWLTGTIISYRFSDSCQAYSQKVDWGAFSFGVFFVSLLFLSIAWVRDGVLGIRAALQHRHLARPGRGFWLAMVAAACAILIAGSFLFWAHIFSWSGERSRLAQKQNDHAVNTNPELAASWSGWAVGDDAKILHTADGGETWTTQNSDKGTFYSVTFPTRLSGWTVGGGGAIRHSVDGGETWGGDASGVTSDLTGVAFVGPEFGWVVGDGGTILHTEDAGSTWKPQKSGTSDSLWSVAFVTRQSGWVGGANGTILHTEDGGSSWKPQNSGTVRGLIGLAFATPSSGWAVGQKGAILHTTDGGDTWKFQASGIRSDAMSAAFVTPESGWIAGRSGVILHTEDGGATWGFEASGTSVDLIEINFVTPQLGWVVGKNGVILHTEDGGSTWSQQKSGTNAELESVSFVRPYGVIGLQLKDVPNSAVAGAHAASSAVLIANVVPDGPGDKAGLKTGDIIVALNGNPVKNTEEVVAEIFALKPGTDARLAYIRNGKDGTADVTIGDGSMPFANQAGH